MSLDHLGMTLSRVKMILFISRVGQSEKLCYQWYFATGLIFSWEIKKLYHTVQRRF